jgi:hypothetical protein
MQSKINVVGNIYVAGVYALKDVNGVVKYIGSGVNCNDRLSSHLYFLKRNGYHNSNKQEIQNIYDRGELTFEIIKTSSSNGDVANIDKVADKVKKIESALASDDAFETWLKSYLGKDKVEDILNKNNPNIGKIMFDERTDVDEKVKDIVQVLHDDFKKMGADEVEIGKLKEEQFSAMMNQYVTHVLTPEGEKFVQHNDVFKKIPQFGDDLGYGRKFNPYSLERQIKYIPNGNGGWIHNPTIEQINEYFKPMLQGKNLFVEDIADIYVTRA